MEFNICKKCKRCEKCKKVKKDIELLREEITEQIKCNNINKKSFYDKLQNEKLIIIL